MAEIRFSHIELGWPRPLGDEAVTPSTLTVGR